MIRGCTQEIEATVDDLSPWVAVALRACAMPPEEISAVLTAERPEIVRRHLELHAERLEERLARQRAILDGVERRLGCPAARAGRRPTLQPADGAMSA